MQLRQENLRADSYNLVGFQNHLKFGEQARVLRLIPGLENARFLRYGQIHRNTYINSPTLLQETLQMKAHPRVLFAGQICGVEGYVESIATGLMAGINAAALVLGEKLVCSSAAQRVRIVDALHHPRRCETLPAREHHIRPAAAAGQENSRPQRASSLAMRAGAARVRPVAGAFGRNAKQSLNRPRAVRRLISNRYSAIPGSPSILSRFLRCR